MSNLFGKKSIKYLAVIIAVVILFGLFGYYYYRSEVGKKLNCPEITFSDKFKTDVSVKVTEQELLVGVKATDVEDGDLTADVIIESMSNLIKGDRREVIYVVCDSDNNVTKVKKEIKYTDYTSPVIESIESKPVIKERKYADILSCFKATDVIDGDITDKIKIDSVDTSKDSINKGVFPLVLSVTNSCGDTVRLETSVTLIE
ncbi:MAG: hypothetical protein U0M12_02590 [Acutalibacteraceae bacterium]|nr:hypothetical protein [Acutalibacteraceae bacterium]